VATPAGAATVKTETIQTISPTCVGVPTS